MNNYNLDYEDVVDRFKKKGLKLLTSKYKNNHQLLDCEDKEGYRFNISLNNLDRFKRGKIVYIKNKWSLYNIDRYIKNHNIKISLISQKYQGSKYSLTFRCECGKIFYRSWDDFYLKKRYLCNDCTKKNNFRKYTLDYIKNEFSKYNLKILDNEYKANNYSLLCETKEGYKIYKSFSNVHKKYDNNIFSYKNNKNNYVYNVNNYFKINNIECNCLDILEDVCGSHGQHYLKVKCCCGNIFRTTIDYIKRGNFRCSKCTKLFSNGEAIVAEILNQKNILYKRQYKFKGCKHKRELPFDFYLPEYNACIEFDGIYHYERQPNVTAKQFNEQLMRDRIKDKFCFENNIKLIRIPYYERNNIKKIILKNLL